MFVSVPGRSRKRSAWLTPLLVAVSVGVFVWSSSLPTTDRQVFLKRWGAVPETLFAQTGDWISGLLDGRLLTLASALAIHADWLHLTGNLLFLVVFGVPAERALGSARFLMLFLLCGMLANLAAAISLHEPRSVIVGASGAVSAIMGAYLALFPRARLGVVLPLGLFLEFVRTPAALLIAFWALLQLLFTFVGPAFGAVAWVAHATGFALGAALAVAMKPAVARRLRAGA